MLKLLRELPLFRTFSEASLRELIPSVVEEPIAGGEFLFRQGEAGTSLYVVVDGEIEILKDERTLAVLSAGALFGEMAAYLGKRTADARARRDTTLYRIDGEVLKEFLLEHSAESARFLLETVELMARRLARTSDYLVTVFETGRIVGQDLAVADMSRGVLEKVLEKIPDATGGMILLSNPFTGAHEITAAVNVTLLDAEKAVSLAARSLDELHCTLGDGVVLRVALEDQEERLGFIFLEKSGDATPFDAQEEIIAMAVADQVTLGIRRAYHLQEEHDRQRLEQSRWRSL